FLMLQRYPPVNHLAGIPPVTTAGYGGVPAMHPIPQTPSDLQPWMESVDAAIGDVLSQPWLPLPLGLKPPSVESVVAELRRQGVS
ncbi:hypothetical protein M569_15159, partial [Genlisea aurea]